MYTVAPLLPSPTVPSSIVGVPCPPVQTCSDPHGSSDGRVILQNPSSTWPNIAACIRQPLRLRRRSCQNIAYLSHPGARQSKIPRPHNLFTKRDMRQKPMAKATTMSRREEQITRCCRLRFSRRMAAVLKPPQRTMADLFPAQYPLPYGPGRFLITDSRGQGMEGGFANPPPLCLPSFKMSFFLPKSQPP